MSTYWIKTKLLLSGIQQITVKLTGLWITSINSHTTTMNDA